MLPNRTLAVLSALLILGTAASPLEADEKGAGPPVPKEVRAIAGTYTGSWALFGIDDKGGVVKKAAWTDTVTAADPQVKGDRAFVTMTDEMVFEGGAGKFKMQGTEGYFLKKDGSLGEYFIETFGQLKRMVKVGDNVRSYAAPADARELGQLGFPKDASATHVLVKVVTNEDGVETHRISRVTTATWKDKDGKERTLQFVSLQGFHKRQP
jgi:hypothetical protein